MEKISNSIFNAFRKNETLKLSQVLGGATTSTGTGKVYDTVVTEYLSVNGDYWEVWYMDDDGNELP